MSLPGSDKVNEKAPPCIASAQDITEMEAESDTAFPDSMVIGAEKTRYG